MKTYTRCPALLQYLAIELPFLDKSEIVFLLKEGKPNREYESIDVQIVRHNNKYYCVETQIVKKKFNCRVTVFNNKYDLEMYEKQMPSVEYAYAA
jgi:hypothetical protein